ncbi:helix-turn-helix domain-containing protein [Pseudobacter ginsenosidimutans]|uniref:Excisionase family DNA binding protein n=1 Tax=Pseudobacter ginsenosidimutans TaxID=661488 RepID=A0A4Q7N5I8_9BACT|nr:helix-turn-helix domain-containing protein [Pseudobacter ginsenosidimutans]QEC44821.1 helix-turn-helix domain-containing protein [Pseudobacter ginsenosidimutans]RZS76311.1 excisionase family DNA binding protein [Pseudobacter ginsenosidimutans]
MKPESSQILEKLEEIIVLLKQISHESQPSLIQDKEPPISIHDAAEYLQLSRSHIYSLVHSGKLKPLQNRKQGRMLFSVLDLRTYLDTRHRSNKQ